MQILNRYKFWLIYVLSIYLVNLGFSVVPPVDLGFGLFSPMAVVVGVIFVVRDYAQRETGHFVLFGMILGCLISYLMASPMVAVASAASFLISELVDYGYYTFSRKPFYKRVLMSSLLATPIDTAVFIFLLDMNQPITFVMMVACKLVAAVIIFFHGARKHVPHRN